MGLTANGITSLKTVTDFGTIVSTISMKVTPTVPEPSTYALMGLGLGCGPSWRRRWFLIGTVAGAVVGLGRIMQGGHFLSDIIFAFYAV